MTRETLFVGVTRPAMRWGVTYAALLLNLVFCMELFLLTRNLLTLLVCLPIHGVCALLCTRDTRFFDLLGLWLRTRTPALFANQSHWRASSFSPLVIDIADRNGCRRSGEVLAVLWTRRQVRSC